MTVSCIKNDKKRGLELNYLNRPHFKYAFIIAHSIFCLFYLNFD